jgi:hypothetical protein
MKEQPQWVKFTDIDWNDPNNNRFNIDTRDFHCGYLFKNETRADLPILMKYKSRFTFTTQELKDTINKLYIDSGGEGEWRLLNLKSNDSRVRYWNLKYLRIERITDDKFIICNSEHKAIPKQFFMDYEVDMEHLYKH